MRPFSKSEWRLLLMFSGIFIASTRPLKSTSYCSVLRLGDSIAFASLNKKAVLPQGNRVMPQVFFSVEVRQQHSLQV